MGHLRKLNFSGKQALNMFFFNMPNAMLMEINKRIAMFLIGSLNILTSQCECALNL